MTPFCDSEYVTLKDPIERGLKDIEGITITRKVASYTQRPDRKGTERKSPTKPHNNLHKVTLKDPIERGLKGMPAKEWIDRN